VLLLRLDAHTAMEGCGWRWGEAREDSATSRGRRCCHREVVHGMGCCGGVVGCKEGKEKRWAAAAVALGEDFGKIRLGIRLGWDMGFGLGDIDLVRI